jgi:tricorn protease
MSCRSREPKRLTWHPGEDIVRGFTADGRILFTSQRAVFSRRHSQFFTIGVDGGVPQALPVPTGDMTLAHGPA